MSYTIYCPNCEKEYEVEYQNDGTYCNCKLPYGREYVPSVKEVEIRLEKMAGEASQRLTKLQQLALAKIIIIRVEKENDNANKQ